MASSGKQIVVVGSINTDLVVQVDELPLHGETVVGTSYRTWQGGKGANQAVAAARLGAEVKLIGMVGHDAYGQNSLNSLRVAGVDTSHVGVADGSSGVALITIDRNGENSIVVVPGANAAVTPEYLHSNGHVIASAALVLTQLEVPIETVAALADLCEQQHVPLMLDPAPATPLPERLLTQCGWFTPNENEARYYSGTQGAPTTIAAALLKRGITRVILKRGKQGSYVATAEGTSALTAAFAVTAVDSTGAGDTYNGAYAVGLVNGLRLDECARFACAAAALSVTRKGAQASMPTRQEVEALLN